MIAPLQPSGPSMQPARDSSISEPIDPREIVREAITASTDSERFHEVERLRNLDYFKIWSTLVGFLYNENKDVRISAAYYIGEIGDPRKDIELMNDRLIEGIVENDNAVKLYLIVARDKLIQRGYKNLGCLFSWVIPYWAYKFAKTELYI